MKPTSPTMKTAPPPVIRLLANSPTPRQRRLTRRIHFRIRLSVPPEAPFQEPRNSGFGIVHFRNGFSIPEAATGRSFSSSFGRYILRTTLFQESTACFGRLLSGLSAMMAFVPGARVPRQPRARDFGGPGSLIQFAEHLTGR